MTIARVAYAFVVDTDPLFVVPTSSRFTMDTTPGVPCTVAMIACTSSAEH